VQQVQHQLLLAQLVPREPQVPQAQQELLQQSLDLLEPQELLVNLHHILIIKQRLQRQAVTQAIHIYYGITQHKFPQHK
jgi:predicted component of type VI protein secretion system